MNESLSGAPLGGCFVKLCMLVIMPAALGVFVSEESF